MILSDRMIRKAMLAKDIVIEPFDPAALGTNSYDVHLGPKLKTYVLEMIGVESVPGYEALNIGRQVRGLDCKINNPVIEHVIDPERGFLLMPGQLYLGSTVEYTETYKHVPFLDGKSSVGRLGIFVHCTAGRGDVGFRNHWTLEIVVTLPVQVYAGMAIGQLIYFTTEDIGVPYNERTTGAQYSGRDPDPQPSRMFKNFKPSP